MDRLRGFWEQVKARKIRRTAAIYTSTAITILGVENLFAGVYHLPRQIFDALLVLLLCGFPGACIAAWYHEAEGKQRIRKKEATLYSVLLLVAAFFIVRIVVSSGYQLPAATAKSIAVLPFENMSDSKEDEYFSDGITEDIITQLSKIADLQVISRTSVMKYKNTNMNLREIGRELNVATVLEGSVRRAGERVRIVGQLIDAGSDKHLWADTYDREMKDIFAIQSDVAQEIASALKAKLSLQEKQRIEKKATENPDAYAYYLRGREYYNHYTKEDNERAIELFKMAIALDGRYALAYAGLGDAYAQRVQRFGFSPDWIDSSTAASITARSIDPNIAEPYKALGVVYYQRGELHKALEQYQQAVAINPNYAPAVANLGSIYWTLGKYDEALPWMRKNVVLNPTRAYGFSSLGLVYQGLVEDSTAEECFKVAMDLQPDLGIAHANLAGLYLLEGKYDQARAYIREALLQLPNDRDVANAAGDIELLTGDIAGAREHYDSTGSPTELGYTYWKTGREKDGVGIFEENQKQDEQQFRQGTENFRPAYDLARINAIQGHTQAALQWLQKAIDNGWRDYRWSQRDPLLENIHNDERFKHMMDQLKSEIGEMRKKVEGQQSIPEGPSS